MDPLDKNQYPQAAPPPYPMSAPPYPNEPSFVQHAPAPPFPGQPYLQYPDPSHAQPTPYPGQPYPGPGQPFQQLAPPGQPYPDQPYPPQFAGQPYPPQFAGQPFQQHAGGPQPQYLVAGGPQPQYIVSGGQPYYSGDTYPPFAVPVAPESMNFAPPAGMPIPQQVHSMQMEGTGSAAPLPISGTWGHDSRAVVCHRCKEQVVTQVTHEFGTFAWGFCIIGCVCCGVCGLWPCCCQHMQDATHKCPQCGNNVANVHGKCSSD